MSEFFILHTFYGFDFSDFTFKCYVVLKEKQVKIKATIFGR